MTEVIELRPDDFLRLSRETRLADELQQLVRGSTEPNVFYEDWMLLPALRLLRATADVRLVCIRISASLAALFPLELSSHPHFRGLPVLRSWRHNYCFLCTPLIDSRYIPQCADALAGWLESAAAPAAIVEFHNCGLDSAFGKTFLPALSARAGWVRDEREAARALLTRDAAAPIGISSKHRKELRRLERRLSDLGRLRYSALQQDEDCEPWIAKFLSLESAGWKGRSQTALDSRDTDRAFFREITAEAYRHGRLQMLMLELGDAVVAMKCNFLAMPGAFAFKIAYDETYERYSPGLLLELFNSVQMLTQCPQVAWMDSCADPGHAMIERLWTERRRIGGHMVCGRGLIPRAVVLAGPLYRRVMARFRSPGPAGPGPRLAHE
jgi:CelD/BcsL family acetyltransferase involved in cellulose biosynthesis